MATSEAELDRLDVLYDKGLQNKVPGLAMVDQDMIQQLEPACTVSSSQASFNLIHFLILTNSRN